jgi:hypothetical protein
MTTEWHRKPDPLSSKKLALEHKSRMCLYSPPELNPLEFDKAGSGLPVAKDPETAYGSKP